ncbi:MAG: methyl-accepting chemotaxis protein [Ferrimicrobium sp.]
MKLGRKALIGFGAVLLVSVLGGASVISSSLSARSVVGSYVQQQSRLQSLTQQMQTDFYSYDGQMNMYVLTAINQPKNKQLITTTYQQATRAGQQLMSDLSQAKALPSSPAVLSDLARVQRDAVSYTGYATQINRAVVVGSLSKAAYLQTVGNMAPSNDIMIGLTNLNRDVNAVSGVALSAVQGDVSTATTAVIVEVVLSLLALAGLWIGFQRLIIRPTHDLVSTLELLADGSNSIEKLDEARADEFGEIARALNRFRNRLLGLISGFEDSVRTLLASTRELEQVSASLSEGSKQTVGVAERTSEATEEIIGSIHSVSAATEQMRIAITEIARSATDAASVAQSAVEVAKETSQTVRALGDASAEVSEVVSTINGIAEQTNLLALNAAIEAARAGEAGKGFAVVASEVKELARNTGRATEEIATKLESIRSESIAAVTAIGRISEVIATISDLQSSIASAVEEQSVTTNEISRVAGDATRSTQEVGQAIDEVTRSSKASWEALVQARTILGRLVGLAGELGGLVGVEVSVKEASATEVSARSRFRDRGDEKAVALR